MKPIRVAHITTIDFNLRHILLNQAIDLKKSGFDVTGISSPGPDVELLEQQGIRHIAIPMSPTTSPLPDVAKDYDVEDICVFAGVRYDMPEQIVFDRISAEYNRLIGNGADACSSDALSTKARSELSRRSAKAVPT